MSRAHASHIHDWWCCEQSPKGLVFACRVAGCRSRRKAASEGELYRKHIADLERLLEAEQEQCRTEYLAHVETKGELAKLTAELESFRAMFSGTTEIPIGNLGSRR